MPYSDCCGYHTNETDYGICPRCKEHCDWEPDEEEDDETMCSHCSGTGEGQYDGSRCNVCKGTGGGNSKPDSFLRELRYEIKKAKQND